MGYANIKIKSVAKLEDLQRWEEHMLEKAKCWNSFCLSIYSEHELRAVYVVKEGEPDIVCITTLCEDCIKDMAAHDILVDEKRLMIESLNNRQ